MGEGSEFGTELRKLRRRNDQTLADLADSIGCTIVHMSQIERGKKNPPTKVKIVKLLEKLDAVSELPKMLRLAAKARRSIEISISDEKDNVTDMLVALARSCDEGTLDDNVVSSIRKMLEKGNE